MPVDANIGPHSVVSFKEITGATVNAIIKLSDTLSAPHWRMVAANAISIAQAHFNKYAWFRAIYATERDPLLYGCFLFRP